MSTKFDWDVFRAGITYPHPQRWAWWHREVCHPCLDLEIELLVWHLGKTRGQIEQTLAKRRKARQEA